MLQRRDFLGGLAAGALVACARSTLGRSKLPAITHGLQSGDVQAGRALVCARGDEPARMLVEWATTPAFADARRVVGPLVGPASDHAATVALDGLPDAQTIFYRVRFEREAARGASAWATARFPTATAQPFRFAWSGDTCGQGFGRNPAWGGLRGYAAIAAAEPRFFLHSGDMIYADNPILAEHATDDSRIWTNVTNERVARVAETLDDFAHGSPTTSRTTTCARSPRACRSSRSGTTTTSTTTGGRAASSTTRATPTSAMPTSSRCSRAARCSSGPRPRPAR